PAGRHASTPDGGGVAPPAGPGPGTADPGLDAGPGAARAADPRTASAARGALAAGASSGDADVEHPLPVPHRRGALGPAPAARGSRGRSHAPTQRGLG